MVVVVGSSRHHVIQSLTTITLTLIITLTLMTLVTLILTTWCGCHHSVMGVAQIYVCSVRQDWGKCNGKPSVMGHGCVLWSCCMGVCCDGWRKGMSRMRMWQLQTQVPQPESSKVGRCRAAVL